MIKAPLENRVKEFIDMYLVVNPNRYYNNINITFATYVTRPTMTGLIQLKEMIDAHYSIEVQTSIETRAQVPMLKIQAI